mgnify:FL=1
MESHDNIFVSGELGPTLSKPVRERLRSRIHSLVDRIGMDRVAAMANVIQITALIVEGHLRSAWDEGSKVDITQVVFDHVLDLVTELYEEDWNSQESA